jgi:hypothetical protein
MQRFPVPRSAPRWLALLLLGGLSACGGGSHRAVVSSGGAQVYPVPGPPEDPWGPYIRQASSRFDVPQRWIRTVIRQESGGREYKNGQPITSDAGAMGLMQLMPATYGELAARYGLGSDPYEPHDNIMAGTGYVRQLYDRYGSPAFLAAYDAGPHRLDNYLAGNGSLPNETVNYLASAAPNLGNERPMSGPLAAFASAPASDRGLVPRAYARNNVSRCWRDPNAAYDPDAPCGTAPPVEVAEAPLPSAPRPAARQPQFQVAQASLPPPTPWGQSAAPAAPPLVAYKQSPPPQRRFSYQVARNFLIPSAAAATVRPAMATGRWAIQVGAFASEEQARRQAESVRVLAPRELGGARAVLGTTAPFGGHVLYRARLLGLSAETASDACRSLQVHSQACVTVPPGG